jgi:hypothetical protein
MANREPEELRQTLTNEVEVNPIFLSHFLNSKPGEILLDQMSEVIRTPTGKASRQSLRAALVSSALPDGDITLIEVLENYPTEEVHVDGDRLAELYDRLHQFIERLPRW